MEEMIC